MSAHQVPQQLVSEVQVGLAKLAKKTIAQIVLTDPNVKDA
jgi:hypothetical protein